MNEGSLHGSETTVMVYQTTEKTREAHDRNLDKRHRKRGTEIIEKTEGCGL
jgi:hypothetical protein